MVFWRPEVPRKFVCVKQPRVKDGVAVPGDIEGECSSDGGVLYCFSSEWLAGMIQMDFGGYLGAGWKQFKRRSFTKVKAADWELNVLPEHVRNRMKNTHGEVSVDRNTPQKHRL